MKINIIFTINLILLAAAVHGQSIAEKMTALDDTAQGLHPTAMEELQKTNEELSQRRQELHLLYQQAQQLQASGAPDQAFENLLLQIKAVRQRIHEIEAGWRDTAIRANKEESYALWHQPATTLEQLVMDYGSQDYVYLIPPEIASLHISVASNLPVPRESWDEVLTLILSHNGVGVQSLNPYVKQLFLMSLHRSMINYVTNQRQELQRLPPQSRICFVLTPNSFDMQSVANFLEKFINPATTSLQVIGKQIFIVSTTEGVQEVLKLHDFIEANCSEKGYQMLTIRKMSAKEMANILNLYFKENGEHPENKDSRQEVKSSLQTLTLDQLPGSLFLTGPAEDIRQAIKIVEEIEGQVQDPTAKTIYWYTVQHSDPKEMAEVLNSVYELMLRDSTVNEGEQTLAQASTSDNEAKEKSDDKIKKKLSLHDLYAPNFYSLDPEAMAVNPKPVVTKRKMSSEGQPEAFGNFIVDPKTGSIIMVVEQELLPRLKSLLKKLDIPKRMVRIDVLLFEKKIKNANRFGLDLLQLADAAPNINETRLSYNNILGLPTRGILNFSLSQIKSAAFPAYNFAYNFLLTQDDIRINSNPSVTTVNHTKATICLVEEISLDTGTYVIPEVQNSAFKQSFSRAQFGITLNITPRVNIGLNEESDKRNTYYITLETDVVFDTPKRCSHADRPNVDRRRITNEVRIENGQTVILGGLRSKISEDNKTALPFLGEIPGVGKFFSSTQMEDHTTEMFVFITPTVIENPEEDLKRYKHEEMRRRPGDLPEFLRSVEKAREHEKHHLFAQTIKAMFGRSDSAMFR